MDADIEPPGKTEISCLGTGANFNQLRAAARLIFPIAGLKRSIPHSGEA
jgi:hypothetical protein